MSLAKVNKNTVQDV